MNSQSKKGNFKSEMSLEQRKQKTEGFKQRYPDKIPIIVEKHKKCNLKELDRVQFLVSREIKFSDFKSQIREKLKLKDNQALFLQCGNTIITDGNNLFLNPIQDCKMVEIYEKYQDKDDHFLYLLYTDAEVFGQ
ncbi:hypothetical protein pb186bvf_003361 [Paramecium bursaria]